MRAPWRALAALAWLAVCQRCLLDAALELKDPATDPELVKVAQLTAMLATPSPSQSSSQAGCSSDGYQTVTPTAPPDSSGDVDSSSSAAPAVSPKSVVVRCDPDTTTTLFGDGFPGTGVGVQQNVPLADVGNKRAPVGGSHFQPLPTNLAGLGLGSGGGTSASGGAGGSGPQILTGDAALASLGVNTAAPASHGRQGQGNGREVSSASGAAAGAKSYAANIVQSGAAALPSQTGGTAAAVQQGASPAAGSSAGAGASPGAAGQQVVSMLAQQPGTQAAGASGSSGGSGASSGGGGGGTSLVDRMTNHILGAGAGSGGGTSLTTAGGQGLLMPGRRRLQGRAAGGVGAERTRARQSARRTLQGWRALARGGR